MMRSTKTFVLLVLLGTFTTLISGQCGYPGSPLGGEVIDADTDEVVGQDVVNGTVSYRCNNDYRLISDDNERNCVDGVWTGSIPMCVHVETREIENIIKENGNTPYGYRLNDSYVSKVFPFSVNSPRKWWAIRLFVSAPEPQSVNWTVTAKTTGTKPIRRNLTINRIEYEDEFEALLVLNTGVKLASLTLKADQDVSVYSAEIHTFPDQCGSPEVPIDGEVEWNTSIAIYRCKKGFQLKSGDLIRQCVDGEWAGPVPVCTEMEIEMTTDEFHGNSIENVTDLSTITEDTEEIEMTTDEIYRNSLENISTNEVFGKANESIEPTILMPITPALSTITEDPWWPYLFFLLLIPMAIGVIFIFKKRSFSPNPQQLSEELE